MTVYALIKIAHLSTTLTFVSSQNWQCMLILQVIEMYTVVMMSFIVPTINALWVTNDVMERTTVVTTQMKKTVVCFILCALIFVGIKFSWISKLWDVRWHFNSWFWYLLIASLVTYEIPPKTTKFSHERIQIKSQLFQE